MKHSICERCFHYAACSAIDVTGSVGNPECKPENEHCDHFVDADMVKIQPKSHWIEKFTHWRDGDVHIEYCCGHCDGRVRIKTYKHKLWNDYYHEHYRDDLELPNYCSNCGSVNTHIQVGEIRDYRTN